MPTVDNNTNDDKCIQRARKYVRFQRKYGRLLGVFLLVIAVAMIGLSMLVLAFAFRVVELAGANGPNQPLPGQGAANIGLFCALGLLFGFMAGFAAYKGAYCFGEALKSFRGDRTYQLLVEYHDGITAMLKNQSNPLEAPPNNAQPQSPPSADALCI